MPAHKNKWRRASASRTNCKGPGTSMQHRHPSTPRRIHLVRYQRTNCRAPGHVRLYFHRLVCLRCSTAQDHTPSWRYRRKLRADGSNKSFPRWRGAANATMRRWLLYNHDDLVWLCGVVTMDVVVCTSRLRQGRG